MDAMNHTRTRSTTKPTTNKIHQPRKLHTIQKQKTKNKKHKQHTNKNNNNMKKNIKNIKKNIKEYLKKIFLKKKFYS